MYHYLMSRKILQFFLLLVSALFIIKPATAQLQFVENKGQWDSSISFKGTLDRGAFALTTGGGYKMLLENTKDLEAMHNYLHGQSNPVIPGKNGTSADTSMILHAHMYEVRFLNANPNP